MKTGMIGVLVVSFLVLLFGPMSCEVIDAGNVGIKVSRTGEQRGVQDIPTVSGYVPYYRWAETIIEYPVFVQTARWEGAEEQVCFNSKDGLTICTDVSLSYQLESSRVPAFYTTFRVDDLEKWTHGYLRNITRDAFDTAAGDFAAEQILGDRKDALLTAVRDRVRAIVGPKGVIVEKPGFLSAPRVPQELTNAINARMVSMQKSAQAAGEEAMARAEANKAAALADGARRAAVAKAEGEAAAIRAVSEAQAAANKQLAASITPELLRLKQIERWDGKLPQIEGGQGSNFMLSTGLK